jgi:RNA polymerase sigma-70 factor (ECF subfamily)
MERLTKQESSAEPSSAEASALPAGGDDRARVVRYLDGDDKCIREVDGWIRAELRRVYPSLRHEHEDLLQTAHAKLLVNLRSQRFEGRSSLRSYVAAIVHRTAIDRLRRVYRHRGLEEVMGEASTTVSSNPYAAVEQRDERRQAQQVLLVMPESCKALWRLVFVEGLAYEEVARSLAIPPGTVKSRMWYCRQKALSALQRLQRRRPPERSGDRRP